MVEGKRLKGSDMGDVPWLDKRAEWLGHWWIPSEPERRVPGTLRYNPDSGLLLSMIGGFEERILRPVGSGVSYDRSTRSWPLILGLADGEQITLIDCDVVSSKRRRFTDDLPSKLTVSAINALVGVHLDGADDNIFTQCLVSVENLGQWSASTALTARYDIDGEQLSGSGNLTVEPVDEPCVTVAGTKITLTRIHTLPYLDARRGQTIGSVRENPFARFEPEVPYSLAGVMEQARILQDLVSVASYRAAGLLWIQLTAVLPERRDRAEEGFRRRREVAFYGCKNMLTNPDAEAVADKDMLFTCKDIPFEEVMPRWFEIRCTYRASINMVLGRRYAPHWYIESDLLTAVGAAEVFHRLSDLRQTRMSEDAFEAVRASLLEGLDPEHHSWVKPAIRNAPTLRDRLTALASAPDQKAMNRLVPDVDYWAGLTTQARNNLTHTGKSEKHTIDELAVAADVTAAVVIMNLLNELKLSGERQRQIIGENRVLRNTAEQLAELSGTTK